MENGPLRKMAIRPGSRGAGNSPSSSRNPPCESYMMLIKKPAVLLLSFMAFMAFGAAASAQPNDWKTLSYETISLYQKGQYREATTVARNALAMAEKARGPSHADVAASLNNLALLYETQGQYAQAEPLYRRSLEISKKTVGASHPDIATGRSEEHT